MNEVMRSERKFLLSLEEFYRLDGYFSGFLTPDKHNGQTGYKIRSLYFDSLDDRDFYEKEDGLEIRRKIRIRAYNPGDQWAYLEMKQKQGANQLKRSLKYQRKAYTAKENEIRLTFDHHVKANENNLDIFSTELPFDPVWDPYLVVFEVKYDGFLLSYIKDAVNRCEKSELSEKTNETVSLFYFRAGRYAYSGGNGTAYSGGRRFGHVYLSFVLYYSCRDRVQQEI